MFDETGFSPVSLDGAAAFRRLKEAASLPSLDYTLPNLWGWQPYFGLEWKLTDRLCWIRQALPGPAPTYWAPIGDWNAVDWAAELEGGPTRFIRVPEALADLWRAALGDRVDATEDRGQWEYLYRRDDLVNLPGKILHKKKTHCNNFVKEYGDPDYRPIDDAVIEDVLALQDNWCQWHECEASPSLRAENDAINHVITHWQAFPGLTGGSIYVDGRMAAFSVGEDLGNGVLGVHFEKGLGGIRGVYQTINREFARHAGEGFAMLNRAQDMDEEGLRQAKTSYAPADFVRKFRVEIRK